MTCVINLQSRVLTRSLLHSVLWLLWNFCSSASTICSIPSDNKWNSDCITNLHLHWHLWHLLLSWTSQDIMETLVVCTGWWCNAMMWFLEVFGMLDQRNFWFHKKMSFQMPWQPDKKCLLFGSLWYLNKWMFGRTSHCKNMILFM